MSAEKKRIKASELIKMLAEKKPAAEVENDEGCYMRPKAEIEIDDEGLCSLSVGQDVPTNPDVGNFLIEIEGVSITVGRSIDGPDDDYEFGGGEIVFDGVTKDDVIAAIKKNVKFPTYNDFELQYNDADFEPEDVAASIETEHEIFAKDDEGNVYAFESEDDVGDGMEVIELERAILMLVEAWSEDGGEVDGFMYESGGPWSL